VIRLPLALLAILVLAGCRSDLPETVPVGGRVTLEGGAWPAQGTLYFTALEPEPGRPHHAGMAPFDADGRFVVTSWRKGDGLVPGKYRIGVECWKVQPTVFGPPPISFVDDRYVSAALSPLELDVPADAGSVDVEWDIPRNPQTRP